MHTSAYLSPLPPTCPVSPATGVAYHPAAADFQQPVSEFERFSALRNSASSLSCTFGVHLSATLAGAAASQHQAWLNAIGQEAELLARHIPATAAACHIHVDGATHALNPGLLAQLPARLTGLTNRFLHPPQSIRVELDAHHTDWKLLCQLREAGYNQLGLLSNALVCPHAAARLQTLCEAARTLQYSRLELLLAPAAGLMDDAHARQIRELLILSPDRITPLPAQQPAPQPIQALLQQAGYQPLGLYSHVLPDDELLDQLSSPARLDSPLRLGLGSGADGQLGRLCYRNSSDLPACLQAAAQHQLPPASGFWYTPGQLVQHTLWQHLACHGQLALRPLADTLGVSPASLQNGLATWQQQGLIQLDDDRLLLLQQDPDLARVMLIQLISSMPG